MSTVKAIYFDIDGTLLTLGEHTVPVNVLRALYELKDRGVRLFIASGRAPQEMHYLSEELREFPFDGYVLLNGQFLMDEERNVFNALPLPDTGVRPLVIWLKEIGAKCDVFELDYHYSNYWAQERYDYLEKLGQLDMMPDTADLDRALDHVTYQITPFLPPEWDDEIIAHAPGCRPVRWADGGADIIPADGGKPQGIRRMNDVFGFDMSECMAFGDGQNDIEMLQECGIGVAMGNAPQEVKDASDYVTARVEDDGIVKALQYFGIL